MELPGSPLEPTPGRMKLLDGLNVVSIEQYGSAPYGTMFLAAMGARVIKVENATTGGDPARRTGPYLLGDNDSEYFQVFNSNTQSVALDLRSDKGKAALIALIREADAVVNNLRGDLPARMGLDYGALASVKPAIVCVHISAYGRDNARASWPGYDYLMQAESGLMDLTGEPDGPPVRIGAPSMIDQTTGLTAMVGLLAGVLHARATGEGCDLDISMFDVALHQLGYTASWYLNEGHVSERQRRSAHFSIAPVQTFPTSDGWLFVMCMTQQYFDALTVVLGRPELQSDVRFATTPARQAHREVITDILDAEFREYPNRYWLEKLTGTLPVAPVLDLAQALDNPFLDETGIIRELSHPLRPGMRTLANPIKIDGHRLEQVACSPMGADNADILGELDGGSQGWPR